MAREDEYGPGDEGHYLRDAVQRSKEVLTSEIERAIRKALESGSPTHLCLDCGAIGYAGGYHDHGDGNAGDTASIADVLHQLREAGRALDRLTLYETALKTVRGAAPPRQTAGIDGQACPRCGRFDPLRFIDCVCAQCEDELCGGARGLRAIAEAALAEAAEIDDGDIGRKFVDFVDESGRLLKPSEIRAGMEITATRYESPNRLVATVRTAVTLRPDLGKCCQRFALEGQCEHDDRRVGDAK